MQLKKGDVSLFILLGLTGVVVYYCGPAYLIGLGVLGLVQYAWLKVFRKSS